MNKKIGVIVVSFLFTITLINIPLILAQFEIWDSVKVSAYGTNVDSQQTTFNSLSFTVVAQPQGSEILNMINASRDNGENAIRNLLPGDVVSILYEDATILDLTAASEPDHFSIIFEGSAQYVQINSANIPEFQPILIVPLFMAITILAIIYRTKRTK